MAKGGWKSIRFDEIPNQRTGVHNFNKKIIKRWHYCGQCGLILLRNQPTMRAAKAACVY